MRPKPSISIDHFTGINERVDPIRIGHRGEKMPLVSARNCDLDNSGMLSLRSGYVKTLLGNYQSLWSNGSICLFKDKDRGSLKSLDQDLKTVSTILTSLNPTSIVSYVTVGDDVYLTDNAIIGYIREGSFHYLTDPGQTFKTVMPAGHLIEYYKSRLYVARDNLIIYSDPATFQYYDKRHNFIWMAGKVTLLKAVEDGIYISDGKDTYFMSGSSPKEFVLVKVADYRANEDSVIKTPAENIGLNGLKGDVLIWASPKGICLGGPGGEFINLTHDKIYLYQSSNNTALSRILPTKNQYLFLSELQQSAINAEAFSLTISGSADL